MYLNSQGFINLEHKKDYIKDIVPLFVTSNASTIPGLVDITLDKPIDRVGDIEIRKIEFFFAPNNVYIGNNDFTVKTSDGSIVTVTVTAAQYTTSALLTELQRLFRLEAKTSDITITQDINGVVTLDGTNGPFIPQTNAVTYGYGWHEIGLDTLSTTSGTSTIGIAHGADIIKIRADIENEVKVEAQPAGIFDNGNFSIPLGGSYTTDDILEEFDTAILDSTKFSVSFDYETFKFTILNTSGDVSASLTFVASTEISRLLGYNLEANTTADYDATISGRQFRSDIVNLSGAGSVYLKSTVIAEKTQARSYLNNVAAKSLYEIPIDASMGDFQVNYLSQRYKLIFSSAVGTTISRLTFRLEEELGRLLDMQGLGMSLNILMYRY